MLWSENLFFNQFEFIEILKKYFDKNSIEFEAVIHLAVQIFRTVEQNF